MAEKKYEETIEFFVPRLGRDVQSYIDAKHRQGIHHVGRYQWATKVLTDLRPRRVIDVACGAGYGSWMLALALPNAEVVGVDYDERAISYARAHYEAPNLSFRAGSMVTWRTGDTPLGQCEAIVSFDTIEHLLHRELAMEAIANNLLPNGVLLLSTPCGYDESRLNPSWEHHKIEFSHRDLFMFLRRYFDRVVQPQDREFLHFGFWTDVINKGERRYLNRMNPVMCLRPIPSPSYNQMA